MTVQFSGQTYGQTLPDQVERIAELFDAHLEVITDVREIYVARVNLEREYAGKLQLLARKASEKKAKKQSLFVVGNEPTRSWDNAVLKQNTLDAAYDEIITSVASSAQDLIDNADTATKETIQTLSALARRNEEAKRQIMNFFLKLLADRDRVYSDRVKRKQKYDECCTEVESWRQKQGRASDDKHSDRASKQAEQHRNDMFNSKNSYLISIAIANQIKAKFYKEDIPQLENELQILQRHLVDRFVKVLLRSQQLTTNNLDCLKSRIDGVSSKLAQVNTIKDQELFIDYNIRTFVAPEDWKFEPCSFYYDTGAMSIDQSPKIVLQNRLRRSREKLNELRSLVSPKRAESEQIALQLSSDHLVGDIDDLTSQYLEAEHQIIFYATSERILNAEIDIILAVVGDDQGASKPHAFKSTSFSIPAQCGYCESMIWGLSKQGKTCRACGLVIHSKCELKVAADCGRSDSEGQPSSTFRKSTYAPRSGPSAAPTASAFVQSIVAEEVPEEPVEAMVLFNFTATSEFELEVREGSKVRVLEADDGSGWVKVIDLYGGGSGLVPASYLEMLDKDLSKTSVHHTPPRERARAMYAYTGQTPDELDLREGEMLELSPEGKLYGNGWWEGFNAQGKRGIFPSNYVELV